MINQAMFGLGNEPSAISELFLYGLNRKAQIGNDKVFDFSIGNPSVPAPPEIKESLQRALEDDPVALHAYTPAGGSVQALTAAANHIKRIHDFDAKPEQIFMTAGAAEAIAITIFALTVPGDEVIVITPFFPEYRVWVEQAGCTLVAVPATQPDFQLDIEALSSAINEKTSAIIINSPNNPVGAIYSEENLKRFAEMLAQKEQELNRALYVISDEPYREITYGEDVPWVPAIWPRTLVCASLSKSHSLPGERIGYVYVSDAMEEARDVSLAVAGAARALGYICASTLWQRVFAECVDVPSNVEPYRINREILTTNLRELGYEFVEPQGAFYLWVRALEDDAQAFSDRAKAHELLLVPSDSFGVSGWVRVSYCVSQKTIEDSKPAFAALMAEYQERS
ncbi:MAG: pyridoxal phosphate-dependent aminotransferase [Eggerthellaceae bacterium]|nr:pyridoxal phosphate-dependent aminotransferase [Eggerthellaceae bacterium]